MSERQSVAARKSWTQRKLDGWKSAEVLHQEHELATLREATTATNVQARFGRDLQRIAEWCVSTCLIGGSSVHTAYLVAGTFTDGLRQAWSGEPTAQGSEK